MPHPVDVEEQHVASLSASSSQLYQPNHHVYPQLPEDTDTSDVGRIEVLDESPNPQAAASRHDGSMWTSTSDPRTESYDPASPEPLVYHAFSIHVLSFLMSFSVFGTLARLGIRALATYDGQSIFPLAWVQAVGCVIMGFTMGLREPITKLYVLETCTHSKLTQHFQLRSFVYRYHYW